MASDAKPVTQLPVVTSLQPNDQLVCISNTASANGGNVSLIPVSALFAFQQSDPSTSTSLTIPQGVLFFSNSFGYFSIANNVLKRFAISSF